jgi:hypothetical protein
VVLILLAGCSSGAGDPAVLRSYSLDSAEGIITRSGISIDSRITAEGKGSLRITAEKPVVIRLFETGDIDLENSRLIYRARIRTSGVQGQVYLEMWCRFANRGEFFSRGLQDPLSGTNEWVSREVPFFLKAGENPDLVKLNLVIDGVGEVWLDDIHLLKGPL